MRTRDMDIRINNLSTLLRKYQPSVMYEALGDHYDEDGVAQMYWNWSEQVASALVDLPTEPCNDAVWVVTKNIARNLCSHSWEECVRRGLQAAYAIERTWVTK